MPKASKRAFYPSPRRLLHFLRAGPVRYGDIATPLCTAAALSGGAFDCTKNASQGIEDLVSDRSLDERKAHKFSVSTTTHKTETIMAFGEARPAATDERCPDIISDPYHLLPLSLQDENGGYWKGAGRLLPMEVWKGWRYASPGDDGKGGYEHLAI